METKFDLQYNPKDFYVGDGHTHHDFLNEEILYDVFVFHNNIKIGTIFINKNKISDINCSIAYHNCSFDGGIMYETFFDENKELSDKLKSDAFDYYNKKMLRNKFSYYTENGLNSYPEYMKTNVVCAKKNYGSFENANGYNNFMQYFFKFLFVGSIALNYYFFYKMY